MHRTWLAFLPVFALILAPGPIARPAPVAETTPMKHVGDAADDPAIWVHPTRPEQSLILGTNKQDGLCVYDLDGKLLQVYGAGCLPNNVDLVYDFPLGETRVDLAVASTRGSKSRGVKVWKIDADTGQFTDLTAGRAFPVFAGKREPYGLCTCTSAKTGKSTFVITDKSGRIEQHELVVEAGGRLNARRVRAFAVKSMAEGCVADDELGWLYIAEERVGIWKFPADPEAGSKGTLIARVGQNGLAADVEGLTLYAATGGKGYLIASSQGNHTFKVYERDGDHAFVTTIDPVAGAFGKVSDTDGIAVVSCPTSKRFAKGLFVAQDGKVLGEAKGRQNFKLYAWQDIAGDQLRIDTAWSPRRKTR